MYFLSVNLPCTLGCISRQKVANLPKVFLVNQQDPVEEWFCQGNITTALFRVVLGCSSARVLVGLDLLATHGILISSNGTLGCQFSILRPTAIRQTDICRTVMASSKRFQDYFDADGNIYNDIPLHDLIGTVSSSTRWKSHQTSSSSLTHP